MNASNKDNLVAENPAFAEFDYLSNKKVEDFEIFADGSFKTKCDSKWETYNKNIVVPSNGKPIDEKYGRYEVKKEGYGYNCKYGLYDDNNKLIETGCTSIRFFPKTGFYMTTRTHSSLSLFNNNGKCVARATISLLGYGLDYCQETGLYFVREYSREKNDDFYYGPVLYDQNGVKILSGVKIIKIKSAGSMTGIMLGNSFFKFDMDGSKAKDQLQTFVDYIGTKQGVTEQEKKYLESYSILLKSVNPIAIENTIKEANRKKEEERRKEAKRKKEEEEREEAARKKEEEERQAAAKNLESLVANIANMGFGIKSRKRK